MSCDVVIYETCAIYSVNAKKQWNIKTTEAIATLLISKYYSFHGVYPTDMLQAAVTAPAAYVPYY